jgi:hypothetical protein
MSVCSRVRAGRIRRSSRYIVMSMAPLPTADAFDLGDRGGDTVGECHAAPGDPATRSDRGRPCSARGSRGRCASTREEMSEASSTTREVCRVDRAARGRRQRGDLLPPPHRTAR